MGQALSHISVPLQYLWKLGIQNCVCTGVALKIKFGGKWVASSLWHHSVRVTEEVPLFLMKRQWTGSTPDGAAGGTELSLHLINPQCCGWLIIGQWLLDRSRMKSRRATKNLGYPSGGEMNWIPDRFFYWTKWLSTNSFFYDSCRAISFFKDVYIVSNTRLTLHPTLIQKSGSQRAHVSCL